MQARTAILLLIAVFVVYMGHAILSIVASVIMYVDETITAAIWQAAIATANNSVVEINMTHFNQSMTELATWKDRLYGWVYTAWTLVVPLLLVALAFSALADSMRINPNEAPVW